MNKNQAQQFFSDAPDGTTHYVYGSIAPFEMRDGDDWFFWADWNKQWEEIGEKGDERIKSSSMPIYERNP